MGLTDGRVMLFVATEDGGSIAFPVSKENAEAVYDVLGTVLGKVEEKAKV